MITTDIKGGWALFFTVVTVPPDNGGEWQLYSGSFNTPRSALLSLQLHWAPGTAGRNWELLTAHRQDCYFLTQTFLPAMLQIERFITCRLSYVLRNKHGLHAARLHLQESFQESLWWQLDMIIEAFSSNWSKPGVIKVVWTFRIWLSAFC